MDEQYKISLGIKLDTDDLQSQINAAGDKVKPISLRVEIENLDEIKKQLRDLGKDNKSTLTLNTDSLEASLKDIVTTIKSIKTSIGTLDSKSGMKSLLSSINQISSALDKASGKFEELNSSLSALANKDFNINFGISMGGSNQISRNAAYGSKVRGETLPQLKQQMSDLVKFYNDKYKSSLSEFEVLQKMVSGTKLNSGDFFESFLYGRDSVASRMNGGSLASQMQAYKQYIDMFKQAASLKGLDISHITSGFSKSADQLVQDAVDVQTGANEMQEGFERLRQIFGGNNNFNIEGISSQLNSIVADLGEIKTALQGLSQGISLDGLTQSFDRMSASIEKLIQNATNVRTVLNDSVGNLNSSMGQSGASAGREVADGFNSSMETIQASATETSGVISKLKTTLEKELKLDRSSIDAITKDIEELGFEVTDASVKMKNGNFDITVKGIDSLGRAITEIRHLDAGGISGVGRTISQSFSTSDDVIRELNQEMSKFVKLRAQIDKMEGKIRHLELVGGNSNQVVELNRQLEKLESTYAHLTDMFMQKLTVNAEAHIVSMDDIARFDDEIGTAMATATEKVENELRELDAKYADTRANLAKGIRVSLKSGDFEREMSQVDSQIQGLSGTYPKLTEEVEKLRAAMTAMKTAADTGDEVADAERLIGSYEEYERILKRVKNQLVINTQAEKTAKANAKLEDDRILLHNKIDSWLTKNSAAAKQFGSRLREMQSEIKGCDRQTLNRLEAEFKQIDKAAEGAGKKTKTFGDSLKAQFAKYSSYFSVASLFMYAEQGLRSMFEQVKLIDAAMTELKKVTNETDAAYNKFLTNAASKSKEIGTTIDGLVSSTADFARLGYDFVDAQGLAEVANIYAVVGDEIEGVEGATESLISTMAAFKGEMNGMSNTDFAMSIIDKFNEIGKLVA